MANKDWEALRQAHKSKFKRDQSSKEKRQCSGSASAPEWQEKEREVGRPEDKPVWQPLAAQETPGPADDSSLDQSAEPRGKQEDRQEDKFDPAVLAGESQQPDSETIPGPGQTGTEAAETQFSDGIGEGPSQETSAQQVSAADQETAPPKPEIRQVQENNLESASLQSDRQVPGSEMGPGQAAGSGSHLEQGPGQSASAFSPASPAVSESRDSEPAVKKIPPRLNARKSSSLEPTGSSSWNRRGEDGEDSAEIPSIYSILLVLAVLGIGFLAMNPPASSSGTSTSYNENQLGLPTSEERKMTHNADMDWIAAEEDKPVVVTYEQVLDLIMGEDSRSSKPDMDQTVAKLGKARSGKETKFDSDLMIRSLEYDDPESGASLQLSYHYLYSPTSPQLSLISGSNLPSPSLPNRNGSLTVEDFAEIQPGRDYQEAVNILGRPDYISWSNVISGQELFYISYELTEDRRVQLKMEEGGASGYQIKEITGLDRPDPAASSAPS